MSLNDSVFGFFAIVASIKFIPYRNSGEIFIWFSEVAEPSEVWIGRYPYLLYIERVILILGLNISSLFFLLSVTPFSRDASILK